jgi:hypothetical protein
MTIAVENIFSIATAQKYPNSSLESTGINLRHQVNVTMLSKKNIAIAMSNERALKADVTVEEEKDEDNVSLQSEVEDTKREGRNKECERLRAKFLVKRSLPVVEHQDNSSQE